MSKTKCLVFSVMLMLVILVQFCSRSEALLGWLAMRVIEQHAPGISQSSWRGIETEQGKLHLKQWVFSVSDLPSLLGAVKQVAVSHAIWPLDPVDLWLSLLRVRPASDALPIVMRDVEIQFEGYRILVSELRVDPGAIGTFNDIVLNISDRVTLDEWFGELWQGPQALEDHLIHALPFNPQRLKLPDAIKIRHTIEKHTVHFELAGVSPQLGDRKLTLAVAEQPIDVWHQLVGTDLEAVEPGRISGSFDVVIVDGSCVFDADVRLRNVPSLQALAKQTGANMHQFPESNVKLSAFSFLTQAHNPSAYNASHQQEAFALSMPLSVAGRRCDLGRPTQMLDQVMSEIYPAALAASVDALERSLAEQGLGNIKQLSGRDLLPELTLGHVYFQPLSVRFSEAKRPVANEILTQIMDVLAAKDELQLRIKPEAAYSELSAWPDGSVKALNPLTAYPILQTLARQRGQRLLDYFKAQGIEAQQLYLALPNISERLDTQPKAYFYY